MPKYHVTDGKVDLISKASDKVEIIFREEGQIIAAVQFKDIKQLHRCLRGIHVIRDEITYGTKIQKELNPLRKVEMHI